MPAAAEAAAPVALAPRRRPTSETHIDATWTAYKTSGGEHHRDRLVRHYMSGHVRRLAERLHASLPRRVDVDDLVQEGFLGLMDAIDRFELGRNVRFETFSARRIYGAMRDYLRAIDPAPRLTRTRAKTTQSAVDDFVKAHGRAPTDDELCGLLGLSRARYMKLRARSPVPSFVSYQAEAASGPGDEDSDAMTAFEDRRQPGPAKTAEHEDLKRWMTNGFSRRDRLIIILYYYEQITMREIGGALGISESRVSQRLDSILACLKARLQRAEAGRELLAG